MNRLFKIVLVSLALAGALSLTASGQEAKTSETKAPTAAKAEAALPGVDQLLDKYVQALGGKDAIAKVTSRVTKGTFEVPDRGITGTFEAYAKAPRSTASVVDIPGFGQFRQGFDGTVGWRNEPQTGYRELSGQELANARRSAEMHQALKLRELYPKIDSKGKDKVGQRDTWVLEADPGDGTRRRMYLDVETGLLLRSDTVLDTPMGRTTVESYMEDYRDVDGVKVPFTVRQVNPQITWIIRATEIHHNVTIDDAKFARVTQ